MPKLEELNADGSHPLLPRHRQDVVDSTSSENSKKPSRLKRFLNKAHYVAFYWVLPGVVSFGKVTSGAGQAINPVERFINLVTNRKNKRLALIISLVFILSSIDINLSTRMPSTARMFRRKWLRKVTPKMMEEGLDEKSLAEMEEFLTELDAKEKDAKEQELIELEEIETYNAEFRNQAKRKRLKEKLINLVKKIDPRDDELNAKYNVAFVTLKALYFISFLFIFLNTWLGSIVLYDFVVNLFSSISSNPDPTPAETPSPTPAPTQAPTPAPDDHQPDTTLTPTIQDNTERAWGAQLLAVVLASSNFLSGLAFNFTRSIKSTKLTLMQMQKGEFRMGKADYLIVIPVLALSAITVAPLGLWSTLSALGKIGWLKKTSANLKLGIAGFSAGTALLSFVSQHYPALYKVLVDRFPSLDPAYVHKKHTIYWKNKPRLQDLFLISLYTAGVIDAISTAVAQETGAMATAKDQLHIDPLNPGFLILTGSSSLVYATLNFNVSIVSGGKGAIDTYHEFYDPECMSQDEVAQMLKAREEKRKQSKSRCGGLFDRAHEPAKNDHHYTLVDEDLGVCMIDLVEMGKARQEVVEQRKTGNILSV